MKSVLLCSCWVTGSSNSSKYFASNDSSDTSCKARKSQEVAAEHQHSFDTRVENSLWSMIQHTPEHVMMTYQIRTRYTQRHSDLPVHPTDLAEHSFNFLLFFLCVLCLLSSGTRMRCWQRTGRSCECFSLSSPGSPRSRERSWLKSNPGSNSVPSHRR